MLELKSLGLSEARQAIKAGVAAAEGHGEKMAFAVVDPSGELIACLRMDGAAARNLNHCLRKAFTAAVMGRNTLTFGRDLQDRGGDLAQWGDPRLTTLQGGLVAKSDGLVVGAVACGGGSLPVDEGTARRMLRAMGLEPVEDARLPDHGH